MNETVYPLITCGHVHVDVCVNLKVTPPSLPLPLPPTTTTHCTGHLLLPELLIVLSHICHLYSSARTLHMQRAPPSLALFLAASLLQLLVLFPVASASCLDEAPYPEWAHAHWIWQSGGDLTQQGADAALLAPSAHWHVTLFLTPGTLDLLGNYTARGIPVGAVNIDSQWQVSACAGCYIAADSSGRARSTTSPPALRSRT